MKAEGRAKMKQKRKKKETNANNTRNTKLNKSKTKKENTQKNNLLFFIFSEFANHLNLYIYQNKIETRQR
jgi:hypothetical protein